MRKSALRSRPGSIPLPRTGLERNTLAIGYNATGSLRGRWINNAGSTVQWVNNGGGLAVWR